MGAESTGAYRVLARKYRPQRFAELIGQEAMVRTLANALRSGRVAHAYLLTGVRGVGKTTTARIIARALNCSGRDPQDGEVEPCGRCEACLRIAESRHVDVIEMDAASRTGVDDIREIIDSVAYAPVSARYKVYIVDEVHMLSRSAFNALLKTLEEPPPHVTFIFATTEVHKVPVTVLSRCQRFDLRRVEPETLLKHLEDIAAREEVTVTPEALAVIARVSEGSVRDALSLLDQAIAFCGEEISAEAVRAMLGLADHAAVLALLGAALRGESREVLARMQALAAAGQDAALLLGDMLDALAWLARIAVSEEALKDPLRSPAEREEVAKLVAGLDMGRIQRAWQMLLKAHEEVRSAPRAMVAAEMALLRVAHAAGLPTPAEAIRWLKQKGGDGPPAGPGGGGSNAGDGAAMAGGARTAAPGGQAAARDQRSAGTHPGPSMQMTAGGALAHAPREEGPPAAEAAPEAVAPPPRSLAELVALFHARRRSRLATEIKDRLRLVAMRPGLIEVGEPVEIAGKDLQEIRHLLTQWTGRRWQVVVASGKAGSQTLREQEKAAQERLRRQAEADPLVQAIREAFPEARLITVRPIDATEHRGLEKGGKA